MPQGPRPSRRTSQPAGRIIPQKKDRPRALSIGVRRGRITPQVKTEWYSTIEAAIAYAQPIARATEPVAVGLAQDLADADTIWTIGAGPNRGTAEYCAAKFHEQNPVNGIAQDLEEWAHLQYFLTLSWKSRVVVMVLAPPGNALDRAEELVRGIADAGGRAIVLAHPAHGNFAKAAAAVAAQGKADQHG